MYDGVVCLKELTVAVVASVAVEVVALAAVEMIAELVLADALEGGAGSVLAFAAAEGSVWWSVAV